ncbi:MAG: hypothetical protein RLP44_00475 [Aggregatilineales bacterium]
MVKHITALLLFTLFLLPNYSDAQEIDPIGIISVAWSPDGNMIAAVGEDGFVGIFDSQTHVLIRTLLGSNGDVYAVDWNSTSTQIIATSADTNLRIWDVTSGNLIAKLLEPEYILTAVSWSPNNQFMASLDSAPDGFGLVQIWDAQTFQRLYQHPVGLSGTIDWRNNQELAVSNALVGVALFDPSLAIPYNQVFDLYSIGTGNPAITIAWSPDNSMLAIAEVPNMSYAANPDLDFDIAVWDVNTSTEILRIPAAHEVQIMSLAWSSTNQLASASYGGEIKIWDAATGQNLDTIMTNNVNDFDYFTVDWSPDGIQLAYGEDNNTIVTVTPGNYSQR